MPLIEINRNPTRRDLRLFACLGLPAFLGLVGALLWWRGAPGLVSGGLWTAGGFLVGVGLVAPQATRLLYVGWMTLLFPVGWVVSHLVLGLVFFGVLTPMGLLMRLVGRDQLRRRRDPETVSFWVPREGPTDPERYFHQF